MTHKSILPDQKRLASIKRAEARRIRRAGRRIAVAIESSAPKQERKPSDFTLSPAERSDHGRSLLESGWQSTEIRQTLTNPNEAA